MWARVVPPGRGGPDTMKYRFIRDDGAVIDMPGSLWESLLARAFRNGWEPLGTECPRTGEWLPAGSPPCDSAGLRAWPAADYFSTRRQYVRPDDAWALGEAVLRAEPVSPDPGDRLERRRDLVCRKVARFAGQGGFLIDSAREEGL